MDVEALLAEQGGVATREQLIEIIGRHAFDNAVKVRRLVAVFPRVYAWPWDVEVPEVRQRAALRSVGGDVALSHLTALSARGLWVPETPTIHVTAYQPRHPRGVPGELAVHRTKLPLDPTEVTGLPTVRLESALTTSWPMLSGPDRRAPAIEAFRQRLVSAHRMIRTVESSWWIKDIRSLRELVSLLIAGCESELELWGYTDVFNVPGLCDATRQRVVRVGDQSYRLDVSYDEEMLNVELDGRAYHSSPAQWERDIKRDLAVAKIGWQTIRLPHGRLFGDVAGCRSDVLAVRAARRLRRAG
jgi:very-short-patch-repair endonuclease